MLHTCVKIVHDSMHDSMHDCANDHALDIFSLMMHVHSCIRVQNHELGADLSDVG